MLFLVDRFCLSDGIVSDLDDRILDLLGAWSRPLDFQDICGPSFKKEELLDSLETQHVEISCYRGEGRRGGRVKWKKVTLKGSSAFSMAVLHFAPIIPLISYCRREFFFDLSLGGNIQLSAYISFLLVWWWSWWPGAILLFPLQKALEICAFLDCWSWFRIQIHHGG